MAFIRIIEPEEADEKTLRAFEQISGGRGRLPLVMQCMSLHPDAMLAVKDLNMAITFGGSQLGRRREEMIATLVSTLNECDY